MDRCNAISAESDRNFIDQCRYDAHHDGPCSFESITVGDEFKLVTQERLVRIAFEALKLRDIFETRKITNAADAADFIPDTHDLEEEVRELTIDAKKCWRYYRDKEAQ